MIKNHPDEICADDVVGCLLSTACSYSKTTLGVEKTLVQLAAQMAVVADNDMSKVQSAIDTMIHSVAMHEADPKAALMRAVLSKIGKK